MSTPTFFFDTADTDYIRKIWDKLGKYIDGQSVIGITTNPNALAKVNCDTLDKLLRWSRNFVVKVQKDWSMSKFLTQQWQKKIFFVGQDT